MAKRIQGWRSGEREEEAAVNHSQALPRLKLDLFPVSFPASSSTSSLLLIHFQEQFEFALTAVAEEVNAILKALPQ